MSDPQILEYAAPKVIRRHNMFLMLLISVAMAIAFAVIFVAVVTLSLPSSDAAHGLGLKIFLFPFVWMVMLTVGPTAGILVFPFFYFGCRSRPLRQSVAIIMGLVIGELIFLTPFNVGAGFICAFLAFAIGLACASLNPPISGEPINDVRKGTV